MALCAALESFLCQYKSVRFIRVRNVKLATIYYVLLFLVLLYVVVFTIILGKGYQANDDVIGTSSVKLHGSACVGDVSNYSHIGELLPLDSVDLVQPSIEENAFFLTTSRTITINQTRKFCDGNDDVPSCSPKNATLACNTTKLFNPKSQGLYTGECGANGRCQMYTWCPLEDDRNVEIIHNVGAFTVFVKTDILFDRFDVSRGNTYDVEGDMHPKLGYNLFTIDGILDKATNGNVTSYRDIAETGAIILIASIWNCNLDKDLNECNPTYQMSRIDDEPNTISKGFNFRTVDYNPTQEYRVLKKLYGIRCIFISEGRAGKFDWIALTVTFGAGLAYLGIASVIADVVLENFLQESRTYVANKERLIGSSSVASHAGVTEEMSVSELIAYETLAAT